MIRYLCVAVLALLVASASLNAASWTYRGSLHDGGRGANGRYDQRLTLLDERTASTLIGPITLYAVEVREGQFATEVDFGVDLSNAPVMTLRTEVAGADARFVALGEPQRFDAKNVMAGVCWDTQGNAGTNPSTDYVGTSDNQALNFRVNGQTVGRIDPTEAGPNIRLGSPTNSVESGSVANVVLGGTNFFGNRAVGSAATVSGGYGNVAATNGTVAGGIYNHAATSSFAFGYNNCAGGAGSFAGGSRAKVRAGNGGALVLALGCSGIPTSDDSEGDSGTFVWADDQAANFVSSADRQFMVRAGGGFLLNTDTLLAGTDDVVFKPRAGGDDDVDLRFTTNSGKTGVIYLGEGNGAWYIGAGNVSAGANFLTTGTGAFLSNGGAWTNNSSRGLKHDFSPVDADAVLGKVLALPISTWQYTSSAEGAHMGPVAEDFHAAFGLGSSDRAISTIDADGVALAAIQGLHHKLQTENAALRDQNAVLLKRLEAVEQRLGQR